jgi:tRNA(Ile)-lysidine synthase
VAPHPLLQRIADRLDRLLPADGSGLLVGLSGGPDSVALLRAARAWSRRAGRPLAAAHLHHGLRDGEADADLVFCRGLCAGLGVPLREEAADPRPEARSRGLGLEEAGRHLRRRFFLRILENEPGLGRVALGHHRDDQAETVVMRLFRGTGPDGLRGIRPAQGLFVRPMLDVGRAEIVACLEALGQPWRTDATNLAGDNLRARIRRELWPVVRGIFGPGAERTPARLADLLERDLDLLDRLTDEALAAARHPDDPGDLSAAALAGLDPALAARVVRRWLEPGRPGGLERVHVDGILAWLGRGRSGTTLDLPGGVTLAREFDRLRIGSGAAAAPPLRAAADYRILVAKEPGGEDAAAGVGDPADETTWRLVVPAAALRGDLQVRNLRQGDRFQPFGLEGTKKLSDLLREKRVPAGERPGVLVVADDEGILWVVGLARAERTRILPTTERKVTISVAPRADHPKQGQ